ncbi:MAG: dTDP-glucose 4,6-dehydratase [Candidatus Omnitrophica bacterium]|nr:dTDP-glucose 4,6-dehydratase [Candidatus Omnitrophota bacterium]
MKFLVTGGAGFIGSDFIRSWMAHHPTDEIVNLDRLTYAGSRARLAEIEGEGRYTFIEGDICEPQIVEQAMAGCETVVHFAAETHVDRSITDAAPFIRTNVEGTHVLLQQAHAQGAQRFIFLSTDEVYGPVLDGAVDEQAPLSPRSPYAASKAAGDLLAQAFHKTCRLPVIVVRPTNIYGPGQFPEKFIPLCITNALEGLPIPVYGDGQQRRAWLFAADLYDALDVMIRRGAVGEIYNVAGGMEQANLEVAKAILALLGRSQGLLELVTDRPGHDRRYAMDDAKLRALGWRPQVSFERGLRETVDWYRARTDWWRPLAQRLREDSYHWLNRAARSSPPQASGAVL